ncbi:beta-glucosidase [Alteromonadaceae bacterium Bs31]|nr:beta-glucosidase [Alteromonadaceae bacterium Bs31]
MTLLYTNGQAPVEARIDDLLARMTLEEKVGQMIQLAAVDDEYESYIERYHLGSYLHSLGDDVTRLQALNRQKSRLNIPLIFGIDAIHGHCFEDGSTVFPVQLAMACTWNTELVRQMGEITANEARAGNLHWTFSPVLCMGRDPRWGRTSETFGEDTLLVTEMAAALTEGYQSAEFPLAACAKHYAAYGEADGGRDSADAHVSERRMREVFLPAFERQARSGCKTFMAGYQALNGVPCSANTWLMNTVLREEWHYQGVVVTDWNNCGQMLTLQNAASSMKEAVELCLQASNDIFMSTPDVFTYTLELVREGKVTEARIDESVRRILKLKFDLGLFEDTKSPDRNSVLLDSQRWQTALQASQQSLTLVKNNGALPFDREAKKILLVGDNADNLLNQLGDWSFIPGAAAYEDKTIHRAETITLKAALQEMCEKTGLELQYLGADICGPHCETTQHSAIEQALQHCEQIIFCAGDALNQNGEFHDRADLNLPGNQSAVFKLLQQSGKPMVSILLASKPHCIEAVMEHSDAVIVAFNPGAKGGLALAQLLFGEINPSGRLPISFPRHIGQLPVYYNQAPGWHAPLSPHYSGGAEYIDIQHSPLLAFGEGMSYSKIVYGEAQLSNSSLQDGESVELSLRISNESSRAAVELVQLYCSLRIPGVTSPQKRLLKYQRASIAPHSSADVSFTLVPKDFEILDINLQKTIYAGSLVLMLGKSSRDQELQPIDLMLA